MFGKDKKAVIQFNEEIDGWSSSSSTNPLSGSELIDYLKSQWEHSGELVINSVSDNNVIRLTTLRSKAYKQRENRIDEIGNLIRQYVNNQAIPQDAHAVFANGQLKGVFGEETHARLKKQQLMSKGFEEESIEIKPLAIESFQDFEW